MLYRICSKLFTHLLEAIRTSVCGADAGWVPTQPTTFIVVTTTASENAES